MKLLKNKNIYLSFVIILFLAYFLTRPYGGCKDETIKTINSPNKEKIATLLLRNCGATTNWSTKVSVSNKDESAMLDFTLDGKPKETNVFLEWTDENTLLISNFNFNDITYLKKSYNPITKVVYIPLINKG